MNYELCIMNFKKNPLTVDHCPLSFFIFAKK